jgi:hypothetical protein
LPFENEKETVNLIMKVYHDFKQIVVEPNIWEAFRAIGFEFELEFDTEPEPYRLFFNEEKPRQSAGFRELWSIDFSLDQLSSQRQRQRQRQKQRQRQRQNTRFDWINKQE